MIPENRAVRSRFGPSNRILELAQHKTSKAVWATTPCEELRWGNQEPIRPVSISALRAVPSARIQYLAKHKRGFSAWEERRRKEEEAAASVFRKTSQYENVVRLSTPKIRIHSSQEAGSPQCAGTWQFWRINPDVGTAVITPRLLQLASPKRSHPDFQSDRQSIASVVSFASRTARISERLVLLSLPKVKEKNISCGLGRPEEPIWAVSRAAMSASASPRLELLAQPKQLSMDYIPPREPEWSHRSIWSG